MLRIIRLGAPQKVSWCELKLGSPSRTNSVQPLGISRVADYTNKDILRFNGSDGSAIGAFVTGTGGKPYGLTFGPDGNLYVGLYDTAKVLKYDGLTGAALGTFVSAGAGGLGTPEQIVFGPDGNLYIADIDNNSVLRFSGADGTPMGDFVADSEPHLDEPNGLAFGPDGNLYVSDSQDGVILRYDGSTGAFIDEYANGLDNPSLLAFAPDLQVHVNTNAPPTLSSFIGPVTSGDEDSEITVTFGYLAVQGDEADADGTVDAFVVKSVTSGMLRIGASAGTATAFVVGANDTINAANNAYWTPDPGANGTLNAFAVVAEDDAGAESTTPVTATVAVAANPVLNDQGFSVDENALIGTPVGTIAATACDPAHNYSKLYWVDVDTDELRRIELDGTLNQPLADQSDGTGATGPRSVTVDDVNGCVYWTNNNSGEIWRANLDGSSAAPVLTGLTTPIGIAVDPSGEKIYWFDDTANELWRADFDGSNAAALITTGISTPKALAIDATGGKVYWTDNGSSPGLGEIKRADLDGSNVETVTSGLVNPFGIALDTVRGKVYWCEPDPGEIHRADMAAGVGSETVVVGLDQPRPVAVDALRGKLYWADAGTNRIERANLDGSTVEFVADTGDWPTAIALGPPTQNLTYTITAGNTNGAFDLDPVTGALTVANSSELDFETTPAFNLTVTVTDAGGIIDTATITVNLNDINDAPVINDATFSVDENSANGSAVGGVPVTDPDAGDSHVYSIPVGNTGGASAIDNAGNITVANSAALNFETTPVFTLTVQVRDQGGTGIIDTATITVNLNDINDAPVINDATFSVDENSANGSAVGGVPVTDPDAGDSHVYSIPVGNTGGAFAIDNAGNITVANSAALNFETTPVFTLTVQVRDQGGTGIIDTATITVNLNDINDAPVINDATFSVDENSANGSAVGGVPVTDPDAGDSHVYSIPVGNTGGAFAIDNAGNITVANSAALNFETTPVFTLTVQVRDQGGTGIIDTATITVNLNDINDAPVINDATFGVDENSANGSAVGGVPVTDPDAGDSHVYSIPVGNTGGAFAIDNAGNITVADSAALDFETTPVFTLTVQVRDQAAPESSTRPRLPSTSTISTTRR